MAETRLSIHDREARRLLRRKKITDRDWHEMADVIHIHAQAASDSMFRKLRRGGTHRGVTWPDFADQGVRKTDGVTVPAYGGVRKLRGEGTRLGRLRPSNTRVTTSSALMQDTETLRSRALSSKRVRGRQVRMSSPVKYAPYQHRRRPWAFWELPKDLESVRRIVLRFLNRK